MKTNSNQEQNNKLCNINSNNVNINNITSSINTNNNNNQNNAVHATEIEALKNIDQKLIDTIMSEVARNKFFFSK